MEHLAKNPRRRGVQQITIPPASEVNEAFMTVGQQIQKRHIEAFKRLADR
ncbi:hypothetical protein [Sulfobacillus sp. hq2]|nr:hypothetical protein [Sulfobacillus sp. hq2]